MLTLVNFFALSLCSNTRGHKYKLFKRQTTVSVRSRFFSERVISIWNSLPDVVNFDSLNTFKSSIRHLDFDQQLRYRN